MSEITEFIDTETLISSLLNRDKAWNLENWAESGKCLVIRFPLPTQYAEIQGEAKKSYNENIFFVTLTVLSISICR